MIYIWCGQENSNFHGLSATTTSTLRVYQFRHGRTLTSYGHEDWPDDHHNPDTDMKISLGKARQLTKPACQCNSFMQIISAKNIAFAAVHHRKNRQFYSFAQPISAYCAERGTSNIASLKLMLCPGANVSVSRFTTQSNTILSCKSRNTINSGGTF